MASSVVAEGRAAWQRLAKGSCAWGDWILLGHALVEGRREVMRATGARSTVGRGYVEGFHQWLLQHRIACSATHRSKLFAIMRVLPEIEAWRATLPDARRARLNDPSGTLKAYRQSLSGKPVPRARPAPSLPTIATRI